MAPAIHVLDPIISYAMYGKSVFRRLAGIKSRAKSAVRKKSKTPDLAPMEKNVLKAVWNDSIRVGSDYAKIDKANMHALGDLGAKGLIRTGDEDDYTVNTWLTPKGEKLVRELYVPRGPNRTLVMRS